MPLHQKSRSQDITSLIRKDKTPVKKVAIVVIYMPINNNIDAQMKWSVRAAVAEDFPAVVQLIKDLAVFEKKPESVVELTPEVLEHDCLGKEKWGHCLVAEAETEDESKKIVGYAFYNHAYSTWKGRMLYLEDLYVVPSARNKGIGMALLIKLSKIAVEKKCSKIRWSVLDWNQQAIDFYEYLGANVEGEWKQVQLIGNAMYKLADRPLSNS